MDGDERKEEDTQLVVISANVAPSKLVSNKHKQTKKEKKLFSRNNNNNKGGSGTHKNVADDVIEPYLIVAGDVMMAQNSSITSLYNSNNFFLSL